MSLKDVIAGKAREFADEAKHFVEEKGKVLEEKGKELASEAKQAAAREVETLKQGALKKATDAVQEQKGKIAEKLGDAFKSKT